MKHMVPRQAELDTPCLVLDVDQLEDNLRRMQHLASDAGKDLRPHAKTHKCSALCAKQVEMGAIGVCAAKVSEADALVRAGIGGILITGPVVTAAKLARLMKLVRQSPDLTVVVDSPDGVAQLDRALDEAGLAMQVLIDLDVGLGRTGVKPDRSQVLVNSVHSSLRLTLRGVQAYAGHVQHIPSLIQRADQSDAALRPAVNLYRALQTGIPSCTVFSASGTGTHSMDLGVPEITELQVGSYALMDAEYLAIEADGEPFRPALRLLTTVVSVDHGRHVTVDAGLKSLYRDGGAPRVIKGGGPDLIYDWFGDEYGRISHSGHGLLPDLGARLEIVVSHCDPTVNLFDRYHVIQNGRVVDEWPIDLRGCSQ